MSRAFHFRAPIEPGTTLIEASAGTGKTYTITGLVLRFVLEGWISGVRNLLVVTFTVAATEELKGRIRTALRSAHLAFSGQPGADPSLTELLEEFQALYAATESDRAEAKARLALALEQLDEMPVSTIHGFCKRVLETSAFEGGIPLELEFVEDAPELLARAAADFWHRHGSDNPWIAALALELSDHEGTDPFLPHVKEVLRYQGVEVLPAGESLAEAQAQLESAADVLLSLWDFQEIDSLLDNISWLSKSVLREEADRRRIVRQVGGLLDGSSLAGLKALRQCAAAELQAGAMKKSQPDLQSTVLPHPAIEGCQTVLAAVSELKCALIHRYVDEVARGFDQEKRSAGVLTFDDQLRLLSKALSPSSPSRDRLRAAIQREYHAALIDEFQDTDPYQYGIFRNAFDERHRVLFVGDPKQSIYGFRGADIFSYLEAKREASKEYSLAINFRSAEGLIGAVNRLFEAPERPFLYDDIRFEPVLAAGRADRTPLKDGGRPPLIWWSVDPETVPGKDERKLVSKSALEPRVPPAVVAEIRRLISSATIGGEAVAPNDIAVLVRTNRQLVEIQNALREAGIPAVVSKAGKIWESREIAELEQVLQAILLPRSSRTVRTALTTELWGYSAEQIHALDTDPTAWIDLLSRIGRWGHTWRRYGVMRALTEFLEEERVTERMLRHTDGERRMTNVRHVAELLHSAEQDGRQTPEDLLRWIIARHVRPLTDPDAAQLRLESDEAAVQITTIHSSKGLEYKIVFAPYLWDGRTPKGDPLVHPDSSEPQRVVYDLGSPERERHETIHLAEQLAEDLRLAYVALTRARHRCYIVWGAINQAECTALGYLLHGHIAATGAGPEEFVDRAIAYAKEQLLDAPATLETLAAENAQGMMVEPLPVGTGQRAAAAPEGERRVALLARTLSSEARSRLTPWQMASFTRWTASAGAEFGPVYGSESPEPSTLGLMGFAAGAHAGQCLHEIFERADFRKPASEKTRALIRRVLQKYSLDAPEQHPAAEHPEEAVRHLLELLATVSLPGGGFALGAVEPTRQINEWKFTLPLRKTEPAGLAEVFQQHAEPALCERYPKLLRALTAEKLEGFLTGIVDLVFEHGGRYYIIDWKSNRMGSLPADYAAAEVQEAMIQHHYVLQYHLYTLGVHRHLRARLPDYDYDVHFGGVWYLFLRGIEESSENGFYFDRPPRALIDAIEAHLLPAVHA